MIDLSQKPDVKIGLVIGKFMPPTLGHQYLIDFALFHRDVEYVIILLCSLSNEPIIGESRYIILDKKYGKHPKAVLCWLYKDTMPQKPEDDPRFWEIWHDEINVFFKRNFNRTSSDCRIFASEEYGWKLAEVLDGKFIPVNIERNVVETSGTKVRNNIYNLENWNNLMLESQQQFKRRFCLFGPESIGKTTMAKNLSKHFQSSWAPEYAREYLKNSNGVVSYDDIPSIGKGQIAAMATALKQPGRAVFFDTDILTTELWCNILFNKPLPDELLQFKHVFRENVHYLLLDTNVPFVQDNMRYGEGFRQMPFGLAKLTLEEEGREYTVISGSAFEERFNNAVNAVEADFSRHGNCCWRF